MDELLPMIPSRMRRTLKRGLTKEQNKLLEDIKNAKDTLANIEKNDFILSNLKISPCLFKNETRINAIDTYEHEDKKNKKTFPYHTPWRSHSITWKREIRHPYHVFNQDEWKENFTQK